MSSEKDQSVEQSSPPQHHPVDVEDNLEDQHAPDRSQILVLHNYPLPFKKRLVQENDAASERTPNPDIANEDRSQIPAQENNVVSQRTPTPNVANKDGLQIPVEENNVASERTRSPNVANKGGFPGETADSVKLPSDWKRKRKRGSGNRVNADASKGTPRGIVVDKDCFLADAPDSMGIKGGGMRRQRASGGVQGSRKKESGHEEERRYGSSSKMGSSGRKSKDLKETRKEIIGGNSERHPAEIALVEQVMVELKAAAEEDAELNRQGKPAINKLKKLHLLTENLSKKHLQQEFLDHGVENLLKTWLEPLPDGSLSDMNIHKAILNILFDLPIVTKQYGIRDQMNNGLAKAVMILSKSDEETLSNRKLAKDLVENWSSQSFNKNTNIKDMRNINDQSVPLRRPLLKMRPSKGTEMKSRLDDSDKFSRGHESSPSSSSKRALRPELMPMDFIVKPQSSIDPDAVRARNQQATHNEPCHMVDKKLEQMKKPKNKQLQATKVGAVGLEWTSPCD